MPITYKTVIANAIKGFNDIQGKLATFTDLGISAVNTTSSSVTGSITPAEMITAIGKMATIKKTDGTFVSGKVTYRGSAAATVNPELSGTTVSYSKTLNAGYYTGGTISGSLNLGAGSATVTPAVTQKTYSGTSTTALSTDILATSAPASGSYYRIEMDPSSSTTSFSKGYFAATSGITNAGGTTVNRYLAGSNCSKVGLGTSAASDVSGVKITHTAGYISAGNFYVNDITVKSSGTLNSVSLGSKATLNSLTLDAGVDDNNRTVIGSLVLNSYTKITELSNSGKIMKLINPGIVEEMYSESDNGNRITTLHGSTSVNYLGTSTSAGDIIIKDNTYGTVKVWNAGADKGVQVVNRTVKVDGTTVTNSSGDLKTANPSFDGGAVSGSTSASATSSQLTLSDTDTDPGSGILLTANSSGTAKRAAVLYNGAVFGWVSKSDNASALAAGSDTAITAGSNNYYVTKITLPAGKTLGHYTSSSDYADGVTINGASGSIGKLYAGFSAAYGDLYLRNTGATSYTKVATSGKLITATPSFDGGAVSGSTSASATSSQLTLSDTDTDPGSGVLITASSSGTAKRAAVLYNGAVAGWVSKADNASALAAGSNTTLTAGSNKYYATKLTLGKDKTFDVAMTADTALDTTSDLNVTNAAYRRIDITNPANGTIIVNGTDITTGGSSGNLKAGSHNVGVTNSITAPSVAVSGTASSNLKTTTIATDYYVTVTGSGTAGSVTSNATCTSTAGWIGAGTDTASDTDSISTTITGSGGKIYIPEGVISAKTDDITSTDYTEFDANGSTSGTGDLGINDGYLYITAGYLPNTKINLGTLIPDDLTYPTASHILTGYSVYGEDGSKIVGTMANKGAVTGTITTQGGSYTIPAGYHNGSGKVTANIAAGSVTPVGMTTGTSNTTGIYIDKNAGYIADGNTYITGVTVPKDKVFSVTMTADTAADTTSNLTITNAAYRTISINGGGDKGVKINGANGKTAIVDGTTVTNSSGDLITATPAFDGGGIVIPNTTVNLSIGSDTNGTGNITSKLSQTSTPTTEPTSGYYFAIKGSASAVTATRAAVLYNGAVSGWVSKSDNTQALGSTTASNSAVDATEYFQLPEATHTHAGGGLSKGTASGGGLSGGGLSGGGLSVTTNYSGTPTVDIALGDAADSTISGASVVETKPSSGYYIEVTASSSALSGKTKVTRAAVTRAAVNRAAFSQSVTRAAVTCTETEGWVPAGSHTCLASGSTTVSLAAGSLAADSTTIGSTYAEPTVTVNKGTKSEYLVIPKSVITNGFVTTAGYVPKDTQKYLTQYNSTDDCVDVIFNG